MRTVQTARLSWAVPALVAVLALAAAPGRAMAECDVTYDVERGETFQSLSQRFYGDREWWTTLVYVNPDLNVQDVGELEPGTEIWIPCLKGGVPDSKPPDSQTADAGEAAEAPGRAANDDVELRILTGDDFRPFSGTDLPEGGLVTELVREAFDRAPERVSFSIEWGPAWSKHLDQMTAGEYDAGFPWFRPNCRDQADHLRCRRFHFSEPLAEVMVQLFMRDGYGFDFARDEDIHGKTVCRPEGYYTHDLDRPDRRWLSEGRITLVRPPTPAACFDRLMAGDVDAVALNEFLGRRLVDDLDIGGAVRAAIRPVSVQGLHLIVPKNNPRATTFLYRFNAGVRRLREADEYSAIIGRHMATYWNSF